jgi:hypothetical protein
VLIVKEEEDEDEEEEEEKEEQKKKTVLSNMTPASRQYKVKNRFCQRHAPYKIPVNNKRSRCQLPVSLPSRNVS